jgi:FlaA1/EpsC-like NDP-sugar epimerase
MIIRREHIFMLVIDLFSINFAWSLYFFMRIRSNWLTYTIEPEFWMPMIAICIYWLIVFFFFGLYRRWYTKSRFDEFTTVFKAATFGVLVLFFAIFVDDRGVGSPIHSRLLITFYWLLIVLFVGAGRFMLHTSQRRLLLAGIGLHTAIIVGWSKKARELYDEVKSFPALGYNIIGFVPVTELNQPENYQNVKVIGSIQELSNIIVQHNVEDVLIALDSTEHDRLLYVIASCDSNQVSLKIIPDLYDIISGQARTNQIYGFPLIEIMPALMQPWEYAVKRSIDIVFSFIVLLIGLPIWFLIALAIKLDSKGPVFYRQERVGKDEKHFRIIKFRSMDAEAERDSGPVWANKKDPRVTRVGTAD